jgi:hypothetical protein
MLHSLPALLNDLEARLIAGEDPIPLLATVRWQEVIGWPRTREEALGLQTRLRNLKILINTLEAPLRATLAKLSDGAPYAAKGGIPLPPTVSFRLHQNA